MWWLVGVGESDMLDVSDNYAVTIHCFLLVSLLGVVFRHYSRSSLQQDDVGMASLLIRGWAPVGYPAAGGLGPEASAGYGTVHLSPGDSPGVESLVDSWSDSESEGRSFRRLVEEVVAWRTLQWVGMKLLLGQTLRLFDQGETRALQFLVWKPLEDFR